MSKYLVISLILIQAALLACKDFSDKDFASIKINELKTKQVYNPPASVSKWEYKGAIYYYVTSDCCDQYSELYDTNGKLVCHPDGGITGKGDGKCPFDVRSDEVKKTEIWKDNRKNN